VHAKAILPRHHRISRILLTYGELALKGRNLKDFKRQLRENLTLRLARIDPRWRAHWRHKRLFVDVPEDGPENGQAQLDESLHALQQVAGLARIQPAIWTATPEGPSRAHFEAIERQVMDLAESSHVKGESFRVKVNRADKRFNMRSSEMEKMLGSAIIQKTDWERVSLNQADRSFYINIYPEGIYVFCERRPAMGGLPLGSGGRLMTMLSGGIDSPVAAWMMAKRGSPQDFIHFTATHQQQQDLENNKVVDMARHLSRFTLRSRLYLLPYSHFDMAMLTSPSEYGVIMFRRFMARVAERLCQRTGALALLNGDSLGQVASQTLENMVSKSRAVDLPILRPLVGLDKQEIIDIARHIDTFDNAIQPYKDCCALIEQSPRTRSHHHRLEAEESRIFPDYEQMIQDTLAEARRVDFECGERVEPDSRDPLR